MRPGLRVRLRRDVEARLDPFVLPVGTEAEVIWHRDHRHGRSETRLRLVDGREVLANILTAAEVLDLQEREAPPAPPGPPPPGLGISETGERR